jgi:diphosphomevalonate decarboxylase
MSPQPWALADIILLGAAEKAISSSEGHRHAWSSPLFHTRLAGLPARIDQCLKAIDRHDLEMLGTILENEALEMHAIMMTSTPPIHYLSEKTLQLLTRVREERRRGHLHAYFTLDAGETIHMICEQKDSPRVASLLRELAPDRAVFLDHLGTGPELHTDAAAPRS